MKQYCTLALIFFVGCGEAPKETPKPVSAPVTTSTSTSAPASKPARKGDIYQVETHSTMEECSKKKKKDVTEPPFILVEKTEKTAAMGEGTIVYACDAKKECKETPLFVATMDNAPGYSCAGDAKKSDYEKKSVTLTMKDATLTIESMTYELPGQKGKCAEGIDKLFEKNKKKAKCTMQENFTAKKL